jgi:hypothetical protein
MCWLFSCISDLQRSRLKLDDWRDTRSLIDGIAACEKAARELDPQYAPSDGGWGSSAADGGPPNPVHALIGLKFVRLEELIFLLRRRLSQVHGNEPDVTNSVLLQYGSIGALLDAHHRVQRECELLRQREIRYLAEPLLRRRRLEDCSPDLIKLLVTALQNELGASRSILSSIGALEGHPLAPVLFKLNESATRSGTAPDDDPATSATPVSFLDIDTVFERMFPDPSASAGTSTNRAAASLSSPSAAPLSPRMRADVMPIHDAHSHAGSQLHGGGGGGGGSTHASRQLAAAAALREQELANAKETIARLQRENKILHAEMAADVELRQQKQATQRASTCVLCRVQRCCSCVRAMASQYSIVCTVLGVLSFPFCICCSPTGFHLPRARLPPYRRSRTRKRRTRTATANCRSSCPPPSTR